MKLLFLILGVLAASPAWALCTGTDDDTAAIQAHIDAGTMLPAGRCHVRSLNATDRMAPRIVGHGAGATILLPLDWDRPVLDLTGSDFGIVRDIQIGEPAWPVVPSIGLLIADAGSHGGSNRFDIDNVQITGDRAARQGPHQDIGEAVDISIAGIVVSVLLSIIATLFTVAVKLVLGRMDALSSTAKGFHKDAMARLDSMNDSIIAVSAKIDDHVRNHATGEFES